MLVFVFFFQRYGDDRDLHSFPTRRSSDLASPHWSVAKPWPSSATSISSVSAFLRSARRDRKSTRLNSSHGSISYAVFCLKKKNQNTTADNVLCHKRLSESDRRHHLHRLMC